MESFCISCCVSLHILTLLTVQGSACQTSSPPLRFHLRVRRPSVVPRTAHLTLRRAYKGQRWPRVTAVTSTQTACHCALHSQSFKQEIPPSRSALISHLQNIQIEGDTFLSTLIRVSPFEMSSFGKFVPILFLKCCCCFCFVRSPFQTTIVLVGIKCLVRLIPLVDFQIVLMQISFANFRFYSIKNFLFVK